MTRPTMRFVPVKSADTLAALLDHKTRDFLVRQRTQIINAIRAHVGEFGIVVGKSIQNVERLIAVTQDAPEAARPALNMLVDQLASTQVQIDAVTARIGKRLAGDLLARRLATIPGVGTISSSAFAATTPDVRDGSIRLRSTVVGNTSICCILSNILGAPFLCATISGGHPCFHYVLIFADSDKTSSLNSALTWQNCCWFGALTLLRVLQ